MTSHSLKENISFHTEDTISGEERYFVVFKLEANWHQISGRPSVGRSRRHFSFNHWDIWRHQSEWLNVVVHPADVILISFIERLNIVWQEHQGTKWKPQGVIHGHAIFWISCPFMLTASSSLYLCSDLAGGRDTLSEINKKDILINIF